MKEAYKEVSFRFGITNRKKCKTINYQLLPRSIIHNKICDENLLLKISFRSLGLKCGSKDLFQTTTANKNAYGEFTRNRATRLYNTVAWFPKIRMSSSCFFLKRENFENEIEKLTEVSNFKF